MKWTYNQLPTFANVHVKTPFERTRLWSREEESFLLFVAALLKHPHICLPLMKKNRTGYGARSQRTPSVSKAERFVWVSQVSQPSASPLLSCKLKRVLNAGMHVRKHTQNKRQQASLFDQPHGTTTSCSNKKQEKTTTSEGRQLKLPQASSKQKRETPKVKAWISPFLDLPAGAILLLTPARLNLKW